MIGGFPLGRQVGSEFLYTSVNYCRRVADREVLYTLTAGRAGRASTETQWLCIVCFAMLLLIIEGDIWEVNIHKAYICRLQLLQAQFWGCSKLYGVLNCRWILLV